MYIYERVLLLYMDNALIPEEKFVHEIYKIIIIIYVNYYNMSNNLK